MNSSDAEETHSSLEEASASSGSRRNDEVIGRDEAERQELLRYTEEFDMALIKYITTDCRLIFLDQPQTWQDFFSSAPGNMEKYENYTAEELCKEFTDEVLPQIYRYELSSYEKAALQLLERHDEYRRVDCGYVRLPKSQRLTANREPKLGEDYRAEPYAFIPPLSPRRELTSFTVEPETPGSVHTAVVHYPVQMQQGGHAHRFSNETHALLSALLSDDSELSAGVLHEPRVLHQRMQAAKSVFEQSAQMPGNCSLTANALLARMQKLVRLRSMMNRIMDETNASLDFYTDESLKLIQGEPFTAPPIVPMEDEI